MRKMYKKKGYMMKIPGKSKKTYIKPQLCKIPKKKR